VGTFLELQDEELARAYVNREGELALVRAALDALGSDAATTRVFVVHGSAGIGKSSFCRMARRLARERGIAIVEHVFDARAPSPPSPPKLEVSPALLLVDGVASGDDEHARRRALLGALRPGVVALVEIRGAPSAGWRREPGWGSLIVPIELRPLREDEAREMLARRGVPAEAQPELLAFARGNPLALGLLADAQLRAPGVALRVRDSPDLLARLCDELVSSLPDAEHGHALEVATLLRTTTEDAIGELVGTSRARELFAWLCGLSFMVAQSNGIYPHELAREVLARNLAWRNPRRREELVRKARAYVVHDLTATGDDVYGAFTQLGHLVPNDAPARGFLVLPPDFECRPVALEERHKEAIVAMTRRHEGDASAHLAARWLDRAPAGVRVVVGADDEVLGFVLIVFVDSIAACGMDDDPVLAYTRRKSEELFRGPPSGRVSLVRYWMGRDEHQGPCATTAALAALTVNAVVAEGVALAFHTCTHEAAIASRAAVGALVLDEVVVGTQRHTMVTVDRRGLGPLEWIDQIPILKRGPPPHAADATRLDREAFDAAVRAALREIHDENRLSANALAATALVEARSDRGAALGAVIRDAMNAVADAPGRALRAAHAERGRSQEDSAEALGLPYSTFRRHLARGIEQLVEELWRREGTPRAR